MKYLFALLLLPLTAFAEEPVKMKPGLWQMEMTMGEAGSKMPPRTMCMTQEQLDGYAAGKNTHAPKGCDLPVKKLDENDVTVSGNCGGMDMNSKVHFTDSLIDMTNTMTINGKANTMHMLLKRVGECGK